MAITVLASTSKFSTAWGQTTTTAIDTTGAKTILIGGFGGAVPTISDSAANSSWVGGTARTQGAANVKFFYKHNPTTNASHTFTLTNFSMFGGIFVWALSGTDTGGTDGESGSAAASVSSIQPGAITPTAADDFLATIFTNTTGSSGSVDSGFGSNSYSGFLGAQHYGGGGAHQILSGGSGSPVGPTWTGSGSNDSAAAMIAFKPQAASTLTLGAQAQGASTSLGLSVQDQISLTLAAAAQGASTSLGLRLSTPLILRGPRSRPAPGLRPFGSIDPRRTKRRPR